MSASDGGAETRLERGAGGLERLVLHAADGARAEVYLHGAHLTHWRPAGEERERLFLSERAEFTGRAAIRGGVPVIFPQFAGRGPLPKHGFARTMPWRLVRHGAWGEAAAATLRLESDDATLRIWPHRFTAELTVVVGGAELEVSLEIANDDDAPFEFTAALHTYLAVDDAPATEVHGLSGASHDDPAALGARRAVTDDVLSVGDALDRVYYDAPPTLSVHDGERRTSIVARGFPDAVIWNPGEAGSASIPDMAPGDWRRMLCVEAAVVGTSVRLLAGERWSGSQRLTGER